MIYSNDSLSAIAAMEEDRLGYYDEEEYEDDYYEARERAYDDYMDSLIDEARCEAVFGDE